MQDEKKDRKPRRTKAANDGQKLLACKRKLDDVVQLLDGFGELKNLVAQARDRVLDTFVAQEKAAMPR